MFSPQIRGFLYGVLITTSLVSVITYASGTDGVFGDYFDNIIHDAVGCGANTAITGFDTASANFGKQKCTTFDNIVRTVLGVGTAPSGQAVVGFDVSGNPVYGDVNWHKDVSENISYTGAGNVGIGTDTPSVKLDVNGSIMARGVTSDIDANRNIWAQAFFDRDNAGYYINPNGISNISNLSVGNIQINDIVTDGAACSPNGSIARDATGAILSCQLGAWKSTNQEIIQEISQKTLQLDVTDKVMGDRTFPDFISCYYSSTQYQITFYFHLNDINSDYVRYRDMSGGRAIDFVRSTRQYQDSTSAGDCAHQSIDDLIAANRAAGY